MKRRRDDFYQDESAVDFSPPLSICPVCGCSVSKDNIGLHVEQHFTNPSGTTEDSCQQLEGI